MISTSASIEIHAAELLTSARAIREVAGEPGDSAASPELLASLAEALKQLSAAWYQLAADAADMAREEALSREQQVGLQATLHDVAGAFASCARTCRVAVPMVEPALGSPLARAA